MKPNNDKLEYNTDRARVTYANPARAYRQPNKRWVLDMDELILPLLHYVRTIPLAHEGTCSLMGITPDGHLYVEEIYGEGLWLAQHHFGPDDRLLEQVDELSGAVTVSVPVAVPDHAQRSHSGWHTMWLNFAGPRHRGQRALERIDALVRPFTLQDKMHLANHPLMNMPPPHILGLAESYVLAEARLPLTGLYFVCRRLRIAHLVIPPAAEADGTPYDYDTRPLYLAHFAARTPSLDEDLIAQMQPMPHLTPTCPLDCALVGDLLYIADGGAAGRTSAVHIWRLDWGTTPLTHEDKLLKRIYG